MASAFRNFLKNTSGATAIEYAIICSLMFLAIVGAVQLFASNSVAMYDNIATKLK